jgi:hypothetical protein
MIHITDDIAIDEREVEESSWARADWAGKTSTRSRRRCSCASTSGVRHHCPMMCRHAWAAG